MVKNDGVGRIRETAYANAEFHPHRGGAQYSLHADMKIKTGGRWGLGVEAGGGGGGRGGGGGWRWRQRRRCS